MNVKHRSEVHLRSLPLSIDRPHDLLDSLQIDWTNKSLKWSNIKRDHQDNHVVDFASRKQGLFTYLQYYAGDNLSNMWCHQSFYRKLVINTMFQILLALSWHLDNLMMKILTLWKLPILLLCITLDYVIVVWIK